MKINTHGDITCPIIESAFCYGRGSSETPRGDAPAPDRKKEPVMGDGAGDRRVFILDHES
jgi:hypothetical protein